MFQRQICPPSLPEKKISSILGCVAKAKVKVFKVIPLS
jgi:hypothetical protein